MALALTPAGKGIALQMKVQYARTLERMFECLSGQEKTQLGGILEKLVAHLDSLKTDPLFEAAAHDSYGVSR